MQPFCVIEPDIPLDVLLGFVKGPVFVKPNGFFFQGPEPPFDEGISVRVVVTRPFVGYAAPQVTVKYLQAKSINFHGEGAVAKK